MTAASCSVITRGDLLAWCAAVCLVTGLLAFVVAARLHRVPLARRLPT